MVVAATTPYRDLFDAVQAKLSDHRNHQTVSRAKSDALLTGRIYDDRGNRMTPSHVRKGGIKYRYSGHCFRIAEAAMDCR